MRDLRADAADGRAGDPVLAERRDRLRRRLPALRGDGGRVRLDPRGRADDADGPDRRAAARGSCSATLLGTKPRAVEETVASEPILRRLSEQELAIVEAADLFNASQYRRTVGGIAKSLGAPRVSVVVLSGVNAEVVVTVAWDISWYQYRVSPDSDNPVRLEERGHDPAELEASFTEWNAHMEDDGRIVPDIARL